MINHQGTKILETKRLLLRRFSLDDALHVFDNWANDDDVTEYLPWSTHQSVQETKETIQRWLSGYNNDDEYHWVIIAKDIDQAIGSIGLFKPRFPLDIFYAHMDDACFEIGYCLSKKFWGKGIMPEAVKTVLDFAFNGVGLEKIVAVHHGDNQSSGKVLLKNGLQLDGSKILPFCKDPSVKVQNCFYSITKPQYCL